MRARESVRARIRVCTLASVSLSAHLIHRRVHASFVISSLTQARRCTRSNQQEEPAGLPNGAVRGCVLSPPLAGSFEILLKSVARRTNRKPEAHTTAWGVLSRVDICPRPWREKTQTKKHAPPGTRRRKLPGPRVRDGYIHAVTEVSHTPRP